MQKWGALNESAPRFVASLGYATRLGDDQTVSLIVLGGESWADATTLTAHRRQPSVLGRAQKLFVWAIGGSWLLSGHTL